MGCCMGKILSLKYCTASGNDMMSALILVRSRPSFTLRQGSRQLRPSALFSFCPQKPGLSVAHASQSFGIGCSFGFGRSMPSASSSLASFIISYACTYFVHNLYTKTNTATNHASNLHPRCLYAGNISKHTKNAKTYDDADVLSADLL